MAQLAKVHYVRTTPACALDSLHCAQSGETAMRLNVTDKYPVCVDISAKIEAWDKPSVVAVANGHGRTLLIPPAVKIAAARLINSAEPVQFTLLAVVTFLAVQPELSQLSRIIVDRDYSGEKAERLILRRLLELIRREQPAFKKSHLRIDNVAGTRADSLAREVYRGLKEPNGEISLTDIQGVL